MACGGADRTLNRINLVKALVDQKADLESRDPSGNTALLKAAATGCSDYVGFLISARADIKATNDIGKGALQLSSDSSGTVAQLLRQFGCPMTYAKGKARNYGHISDGRAARYNQSANDPDSKWFWGKDRYGDDKGKGKRKWHST